MQKGWPTPLESRQKGWPATLDVLVHNVSHADVVLSLGDELLARPRFSSYSRICQQLRPTDRLAYARAERRDDSRREYPVLQTSSSEMAAGLDLEPSEWDAERIKRDLKVRRRDVPRLYDNIGMLVARTVYFPLIALVVRAWLDYADPDSEKVVILVTGTGTPRDETAPEPRGNSTEAAGALALRFVERLGVKAVQLHSETNVFRYDENISFVRHELEPAVEALRHQVVGEDDWARRFRVSVSIGDGAPARVSTIHRALRAYRPTCVHVWQPKTFWEYAILSRDDVEVLPFEATETMPAQPAHTADHDLGLVVDEMLRFKDDFQAQARSPNDMAVFWHRKSRKVVLAVLLVNKDGNLTLYRGTNMEVSMPTGSLCAERNVIGTALAEDLSLRRSHLRVIAVLGLHVPPPLDRSTSDSAASVNDLVMPAVDPAPAPPVPPASPRKQVVRSYPKISKGTHTTPASTTLSYVVEQRDFNPLRPCGACAEWLKKIASVNPEFAVLTFTDSACQGFYVEPAILY